MYCRGRGAAHDCVLPATNGVSSCRLRSVEAQRIVVLASVDAKLPARVVLLPDGRAVSWNPHAFCAGSAMVTTRCCFTPGVYVRPFGKLTLTLPPPAFTLVPTWHCA